MPLASKLQTWQSDLLDMTRRNNLLYYGIMRGARGVQLLGDAGEIFRRLAGPHPRPYRVDPVATDLPDDCEKRLNRLRARAREAYNDRGTHVLYVGFGMLRWKESVASTEIINSPLVLVPVELKREGALGAYSIVRAADEEIAVNPALAEKFRHDFGIQLPSFAELCETAHSAPATSSAGGASAARESLPTLVALLAILGTTLQGGGREVAAEVHLGIFSFQKLVMYQDMKRHSTEILAHALLRLLGGEQSTLPRPGGLYPAGELDRKLPPRDVLEILDADSSQQEAIVAAKAGASFVLRGPPGTGKSQTIGNIIAECLGQGRSVLFVSEKRAALEVVGTRLSDAGLGEFLLDLHSHSADKKQLVTDLAQALAEAASRASAGSATEGDWDRASDAVARSRSELNDYVTALHLRRTPLDRSAWDAYGALARLATTPDTAAPVAGVGQTTRQQLDDRRRALEELLNFADVLDRTATHPWCAATVTRYSHELEGNLRAAYTDLLAGIDALEATMRESSALLGAPDEPPTFAAAELVLRRAECATQTLRPPREWLVSGTLEKVGSLAQDAAARSARHRELRMVFDRRYDEAALALDHDSLLAALEVGITPVVAMLRSDISRPYDKLLAARSLLDPTLEHAVSLLAELLAAAESLAQTCRQPAVESVADAGQTLAAADWLLEAPRVPSAWLDYATYARVRAVALDARDRATACARQRAILSERYTEAVFDLDAPALAMRFRGKYSTLLRYVRPAYYADRRALRACQRKPEKRAHENMQADALLAEKLALGEADLRQRQPDHAAALEQLYDGERTDWPGVAAAVQWTDRLGIYYPDGLPQDVARMIESPARGLKAVQAQRDRLATLWDEWHDAAAVLAQTFAAERLQPGIVALEDAEPETLAATLRELHTALTAFWAAAGQLATCRRSGIAVPDWATMSMDLHAAHEIAGIAAWFVGQEPELANGLGHFWRALATDWSAVNAALHWTRRFVALYDGAVPESAQRLVAAGGGAGETERMAVLARNGRAALARIAGALRFSDTVLPRAALLAPAATLDDAALVALRSTITQRLEHLAELERWIACQEQRRRCEADGLGDLVTAGLRESPFPRDLADRYEKRFYQLWLDAVLDAEPALRRFRGETHEQLIARFGQQDERHLRLARARLRAKLAALRRQAMWQALSDTMTPLGAAFSALRREVAKKRHPSIRQIVRQTGPALVRIKPCWMMSPLSISQYVESGDRLFDVVVFDEASQVCPEDAICAIFRGAQLIVVGDEKQLPPTRFFAATYADDDDEDGEGVPSAQSERTASILEECDAAFPDRRMLRWHYRSRHESLIAFSNAHFYHNALQTFPGPQTEHEEGVRFEYVADGVYDRGGSHTNWHEAARVVDLAIDHLRRQPSRSAPNYKTLGVVTMSQSQQQKVRDEIEYRLKRDRTLGTEIEHQLEENDDHGFFVKNLESVQGDERDVILLDIGYGYDAPPDNLARKLSLNFGPVNREGGERRLNVAVTRAREQVVLVASMRAADLPPNMASAGARTLRDYLDYAEHGTGVLADQARTLSDDATRTGFDSPFEQAVYDALSARGLSLTSQVGCAGYYIDLAVRDPSHPGRYLLGIECDGATYHSAKTARDRDRLRQQQLERLGWRIHRIWSRDWVHNQAGEIDKVIRALDEVRRRMPTPITVPPTARLGDNEPRVERGRDGARLTRILDDEDEVVPGSTIHSLSPRASRAEVQPADGAFSAHPAPLSAATHICEACAFYQFHAASRFYCGHDAAYKLRDPQGRTAGCPAWRRRV